MPTYQYACTSCGHRFEQVQAFSDASLTDCPVCSGKLRKVYGAVGVVFKGSGFYRNDARAGGKPGDGGTEKGSGSESGSGDSGSGDSSGSGKDGAKKDGAKKDGKDTPATAPAAGSSSSSGSSSTGSNGSSGSGPPSSSAGSPPPAKKVSSN